jgi:hypothetical protein
MRSRSPSKPRFQVKFANEDIDVVRLDVNSALISNQSRVRNIELEYEKRVNSVLKKLIK